MQKRFSLKIKKEAPQITKLTIKMYSINIIILDLIYMYKLRIHTSNSY